MMPTALHLVLFFTRATSLQAWDEVGMFGRETALYERLVDRGFRVTFVTYGGKRDRELAERIPAIQVVCNEWNLPDRRYQTLLTTVYPLRWGRHAIFKSNQVKGAEVALLAARRHRRPFVARCGYLESHFSAERHGSESRRTRAAIELERTVFREATRVSVTTGEMARRIGEAYGVEPSRLSIIPNCVNTRLFSPCHTARVNPGAAGTPPRRMTVVFVGRLTTQKNVRALLDALAELPVDLLVIGTGELAHDLRASATSRQLPVVFLDRVVNSELPCLLKTADLFVLPSLYEGHPKALIEAMACGLPVLGTDVTGIREVITHGETGWLCGTTATEIRRAIERLSGDPDLMQRLGRAARDFVTNRYSLDRVAEAEAEMLHAVHRGVPPSGVRARVARA